MFPVREKFHHRSASVLNMTVSLRVRRVNALMTHSRLSLLWKEFNVHADKVSCFSVMV